MGYELQSNGNTYIGTFKEGVKNGNGTYYWFTNNEIFTGEWHGGLPHGTGVYLSGDDKDKYEGMFSNGLKYGFGVENFANGDKYVGKSLHIQVSISTVWHKAMDSTTGKMAASTRVILNME